MDDNHNLIYAFLRKYNLSYDDYYDLAAIGLCEAAIQFDSLKGSFSSYAFLYMLKEYVHSIKYDNRFKRIPKSKIVHYQKDTYNDKGKPHSMIEHIKANDNTEEYILSKEMVEQYLKGLKDKDKQIILMLSDGYSQKEIAKLIGCSIQNISRIKKRISEYFQKTYFS